MKLTVFVVYIVWSVLAVGNMATPSPENFKIGEWVTWRGELCRIVDIQATHLGYRAFCVQHFETGMINNASKHELQKAVLQEVSVLNENWDEDIPEYVLDTAARPAPATIATATATAATATATTATATTSCHAQLDESEMDEIAKARLSHNSEKQTKWAVALLRGMKQVQ